MKRGQSRKRNHYRTAVASAGSRTRISLLAAWDPRPDAGKEMTLTVMLDR